MNGFTAEVKNATIEQVENYRLEQVEEYNRLTNENEHGEALKLVCKYFNRPLDVTKLDHINALHELYGSLRPELKTMRDEIYEGIRKKFYTEFLKTMSIEEYENIFNGLDKL